MIQALRNDILNIVMRPTSLSVEFTILFYQKRNQFRDVTYSARTGTCFPHQAESGSKIAAGGLLRASVIYLPVVLAVLIAQKY